MFDWGIQIKAKTGVQNEHEKYQMGAFENRDLAYERMVNIWKAHVNIP